MLDLLIESWRSPAHLVDEHAVKHGVGVTAVGTATLTRHAGLLVDDVLEDVGLEGARNLVKVEGARNPVRLEGAHGLGWTRLGDFTASLLERALLALVAANSELGIELLHLEVVAVVLLELGQRVLTLVLLVAELKLLDVVEVGLVGNLALHLEHMKLVLALGGLLEIVLAGGVVERRSLGVGVIGILELDRLVQTTLLRDGRLRSTRPLTAHLRTSLSGDLVLRPRLWSGCR